MNKDNSDIYLSRQNSINNQLYQNYGNIYVLNLIGVKFALHIIISLKSMEDHFFNEKSWVF